LTPVGRLRTMLVAGQAAASTLLLVVTALFVRSLVNASTIDIGFDTGRLMVVQAEQGVERRGWDANRIHAFRDAVLSHVEQVPGVAGATLVERVPFSGVVNRPMPNGEPVTRQETTADYFETVGVRVLRGRTYTPDEVRAGAPVAVISARLAQRAWGSDDPIGSSMERAWGMADLPGDRGGIMRRPAGTRVIGVVADTVTSVRHADVPTIYLPLAASTPAAVIVATTGNPHEAASRAERRPPGQPGRRSRGDVRRGSAAAPARAPGRPGRAGDQHWTHRARTGAHGTVRHDVVRCRAAVA
jgi:hypothetical protein